MYRIQPYTGADLPPKHLCLTYDDGPGKDTYGIAKFLFEQGIQATFFVVGKYAFHHPGILENITALGHLIGNHTYEHPDMPYYLSANGDIHNQILRTDAVIRKYIAGPTVYFRSPYGKWSKEVADELNLNLQATVNHVGPIHWDVGGIDCYCWQLGKTIAETVSKYLEDINVAGRGIVVMHDEIADMNFLKEQNHTLELTRQLIPLLKAQGFTFVRLDEIPSIRKDASERYTFRLKCRNGKYVSLSKNDGCTLYADGGKNTSTTELSMEELSHGKIVLRASNGLFLSLHQKEGNAIKATGTEINDPETFDLIPFSGNQIALKGYNGNYLMMEKNSGKLLASAPYMRGGERFYFFSAMATEKKKISLRQKYKSAKRQFLYIKSKIQQSV